MIDQVKQLLEQRGIEHDELTNGGVRFTYRDHAIEIYKQSVVCDELVFAYNDEPPEEDCWDAIPSLFEDMSQKATEYFQS